MLVFEVLPVLAVEDLLKCKHDDVNLDIVQSILRKLVFMFELDATFQEHIWQ